MNFSAPLALTILLGLTSCSSVKSTMKKVTDPIKSMAKANSERIRNLRRGKNANVPPVVAVRKEDLKSLKSGEEKILAWKAGQPAPDTTRLPDDFDPSKITIDGQMPLSGLLPPLNPGSSSSTEIATSETDLPDSSNDLPSETALPPSDFPEISVTSPDLPNDSPEIPEIPGEEESE